MAADEQDTGNNNDEQKFIQPQKIYLKDASLEAPNSPEIFTRDWKPKMGVELNSSVAAIADDMYDVVLTVTATATIDGSTAYLAEVHQAGIFIIKGFAADEIQRIQNVYCLNTLYPYACAQISDLVTKGGFPQLTLRHTSFQRLYAKRLQEAQGNTGNPEE